MELELLARPRPAAAVLKRWLACFGAIAALGFAVSPRGAGAQEFPAKPIRFIVPYVPGGPTDLIARTIAIPLSSRLKQPVVVENRPGASGAIGTALVANAPRDGYTLLLSNIGDTVATALGVKVPYDYLRDLRTVTLLGTTPFVLVVGAQLPAKNVSDLLQYAKSNPASINFGSSGTGSASQLAGELFISSAGIRATHIPYKGQAEASTALIGGQLTFMFANPVNALPQIKGGTLRALAVSGQQRFPSLPDVPIVRESGIAGYGVEAWFGLMTTGGTPDAVVARLNAEVLAILQQPEVREKLLALGVEAKGNTPAQFANFIGSEIQRWTKVVRDAHIHID
jgi:tripartite-type tricarboxylate transporter receptor subunit TctC